MDRLTAARRPSIGASKAAGNSLPIRLNIFFDVDYTIMAADGSLRPGTSEVFERLVADSHHVFVWSGVGNRSEDVRRLELDRFVSDVFEKPLSDFDAGLVERGGNRRPDFVIDDYPEIVRHFGGVQVRPYYFASASDQEMDRVYRIVAELAADGASSDPAYQPGRPPPESDPG